MNFPDTPPFELIYWLINTPGVGGLIAILLGATSMTAYLLTLRWIQRGGDPQARETYAYPTPALHEHEDSHARTTRSTS